MERIIHHLVQGTPEWHQFRLERDGASEAAPMLGLSKKTARSELMRMKHTGLAKEFSDWVQEHVFPSLREATDQTWVADNDGVVVGHLYGAMLESETYGNGVWIGPDGVSFDNTDILSDLYSAAGAASGCAKNPYSPTARVQRVYMPPS